jgi:HEAT repeat protein
LIGLLDSEGSAVKYCSARLLGERKETSAIPQLEKALSDKSPGVQRGVTIALLKMGDRKGIPVLQEFVERASQEVGKGNDENVVDQLDALVILADAGEVSAIPYLRKLLEYDRLWGVRIGALRSLMKLYEKDTSVLTDIASMQDDEHPQIRKEASRFLLRAESRK